MKKQDLEKKVKGLEGLVESQRNTIQQLVDQRNKFMEKEAIEEKDREKREIIVRANSPIKCDMYEESASVIDELKKEFSIYVSDNELEAIKYFINIFNIKFKDIMDIDLYRQILD